MALVYHAGGVCLYVRKKGGGEVRCLNECVDVYQEEKSKKRHISLICLPGRLCVSLIKI